MLRVHSIQSLGAVDGPGVRFVVFLQGCPLRCKCCHNPDTWDVGGGKEMTAEEIVCKAERYKEYFGKEGGITVSGGEPLMQAGEVYELFRLCKEAGINTCLDTSGCVMSKDAEKLLTVTDRVLLDIKYTDSKSYLENVGCSYESVLHFLDMLNEKGVPTTLRQVTIPGLSDDEENILRLKEIKDRYKCADSAELLPFKKLCRTKYETLGLEFPLDSTPEPTGEKMAELSNILNS